MSKLTLDQCEREFREYLEAHPDHHYPIPITGIVATGSAIFSRLRIEEVEPPDTEPMTIAEAINDLKRYANGHMLTPPKLPRMKGWLAKLQSAESRIVELESENARLTNLINCPHNDDWFDGVKIEAAHQQERWGNEYDAGKEPQDWFWLIGYLAGKCLRASIDGDKEKSQHHTISTAAVLLNWYRRISGQESGMRPGMSVQLEKLLGQTKEPTI